MNLNTNKTQIFQFLHSSIVRQKGTSKLREPTDDRIYKHDFYIEM